MTKHKKILVLIVIMMILTSIVAAASTSSVWTERRKVTYTGGESTVSIVWANLEDDRVRIEAVLADGKVGDVAWLNEIVESASDTDGQAIAGINGTFFAAYTDFQSLGTVIMNGETIHISNQGSTIAISEDNSVQIDPLYVSIAGGTNNQWEWPYNWYSWNINHYYSDPSAVMIFNRHYNGVMPEHTFTAIEVDKQVVTNISKGSFNIPTDGFLLLTNDQDMIDKFVVGESADFLTSYYENDYTSTSHNGQVLDYSNIRTSIGAGPTLVKNGEIVLDGASEGFTDDKLLVNAAMRSLVGVRADGVLGMLNVSGVTMEQLAEIAINLGMVEAINLDGGASSGVYYDGAYLNTPGREVSNALVVKYLYEDPIRIELNDQVLFFDTDPYLNNDYDRTLVPLRGIAEALGAVVGWDSASSSISITRESTELLLKADSTSVYVNGDKKVMDLPVTIRDSRSYVPVRFITEYFGGDVTWDQATKTVGLFIEITREKIEEADALYDTGNYKDALIVYKEILLLDQDNLHANKRIADIYNTKLSDATSAIPYYEEVLKLDSADTIAMGSLAWSYYGIGRIDDGINTFLDVLKLTPNSSITYYGIALCYSSYTKQDETNAIKYFELAIKNGLSGSNKEYADKYINEH